MGTLLVLSGFALWPAQPGAPLLVREAWDAPRFWTLGLPLLLLVPAIAAGAHNDVASRRLPLPALVGLPCRHHADPSAGSDLGLLTLALILIGAPLYGALSAAGLVKRRVGDAIQG
jgi:hypothetical protein